MSSGIEVMICHAENVSRHLERVREDLTELRLKERLVTEESVTSVANRSSLSGKTLFFQSLHNWKAFSVFYGANYNSSLICNISPPTELSTDTAAVLN